VPANGIKRFVSNTTEGGTRFGSHFLEVYQTCPTKWFNQFKRPHPQEGGEGVRPARTASPLLVGGAFHEALDVYYRSGFSTGRYSVDLALSRARECILERKDEFEDQDIMEKDWLLVQKLVQSYADHYGPGGVDPEWPRMKIIVDSEGEPVIEREYEIDLDFKDYIYTCRIDALVESEGYLNILEHKTTSASQLHRLFDRNNMGLQATGEYFVLQTQFPDEKINGVMVSAIVKDRSERARSKGEPDFLRRIFSRTHLELDKFRINVIKTLGRIEADMEEYVMELERTGSVDEAARIAFVQHRAQCCVFRRCEYYGPCATIGRESIMFRSGFKPRIRERILGPDDTGAGDNLV